MGSRKVAAHLRKRCAQACDNCKRRKERCNGNQPCNRCSDRGVGEVCNFGAEQEASPPRQRRKGLLQTRVPQHADLDEENRRSHCESPRQQLHSITSSHQQPRANDATDIVSPATTFTTAEPLQAQQQEENTTSPSSIEVDHTRFLQDKKGRYIFIGNSANLSFLHTVRCVVREALGPCPFVDDPLRSSIVEASPPESNLKRLDLSGNSELPELSANEAEQLVQRFFYVTSGLVDLFESEEIYAALPHIQRQPSHGNFSPQRAIIYMIFAIGAQSGPDPKHIADAYYNRGRILAGLYLTDDINIQSTQLYLLLSLYLLGASRRNVAFVCLGHAVRSAYTLGIHQQANTDLFREAESRERSRLWSSIRVVDLFTSASLGRPPATASLTLDGANPASLTEELYDILETILTDVYGQHRITTPILAKIGARQRNWAAKLASINENENSLLPDEEEQPNMQKTIQSMNLKQAYYWTIMLLTRPFLVDRVTARAKEVAASPKQSIQPCVANDQSKTLIYACVDSAVKTISLLEPLTSAPKDELPYHLPILINAAFHAALVLGFSYFGDLYQAFPLDRALLKAEEILLLFPIDSIALRYLAITQYMRAACSKYSELRRSADMGLESDAIGQLFGQIHAPARMPPANGRRAAEVSAAPRISFSDRGREQRRAGRGTNTHTAQNRESAASADDSIRAFDSIMLSPPHTSVGFEDDLLAQLAQNSDLDLEFPATAQHIWVDSGTDLPMIFGDMSGIDPSIMFMGQ